MTWLHTCILGTGNFVSVILAYVRVTCVSRDLQTIRVPDTAALVPKLCTCML